LNPDFWREVQSIFAIVAEAPLAARSALLDQHCGDRADLRAEVESLLTSSDQVGDFLEMADRPGAADESGGPAADPLIGRSIGGFRLTEQIGRGGMGSVYAALRDGREFTQRVAVKLIDLPLRNDDALRRFRSERRILAALNHPHIVTFLDGGLTDDGQAFLVMEYVEGLPITRYCAERRSTLEERLRLCQLVCGAVHYAHQHAVVHRDLKPGNILVTAAGAPKMLDFGVARLLDSPDAPADATTGHPLRALTPNYASPEQLRGLPVTTSSDIYSLGVLLFEMLTGTRPYETSGQPLDGVLRMVLEGPRRRPSDARPGDASRPPYPASRLRGDLDAIVLKSLSLDSGDRYASAQELSADVGRYLSGTPVVAREPSLRYVVSHLARRHRAAFAAIAVSVVAIVAALGVSLWQGRVARRERQRAEQRFGDARQLASAVIFDIHDAVSRLEGSTPVRQRIVAEALKYLERLSRDPAGDAAFRIELARAYLRIGTIQGSPSVPNLGDRTGARESFVKAIAILEPLAADPSAAHDAAYWLVDVQRGLAGIAQAEGALAEQRSLVDAATRLAESLVERRGDLRARTLLGSAYFDQALLLPSRDRVPAWTRAAATFERLLAERPDDPNALRSVALVAKYFGATHESRGEYAEALTQHRKALAIDEQRLAARPGDRFAQFDVAIDLSNIAFTAWQTGQLEDAATGYERSLAIREQLVAADPKDVQAQGRLAYVQMRLAVVYGDLKRFDEALPHARRALETTRRLSTIDEQHLAEHAATLEHYGRMLLAAGRAAEGCAELRNARAAVRPLLREGVTSAVTARVEEVTQNTPRFREQCGG
jgi:non-specific serine/threonine protein kinase/serine/threonine-protein kinase